MNSKVHRRSRMGRRQGTLSVESILRKSAREALKEYTKQSSIPLIAKACDPDKRWIERFVWMIVSVIMLVCLYNALNETWINITSRPLILNPQFAVEPLSETDFPAVAFCNINRVSKIIAENRARTMAKKYNLTSDYGSNLFKLYKETGRLLDFSYNESTEVIFANLIHHYLDNELVINITKQLAPDCNQMMSYCSWNDKVVNCSELFTMRRTGHGYCCAFNYVLDYDENGFPYRNTEPERQEVAGFRNGLVVSLDPLLKDYAYPLRAAEGFDIFIFEPTHFADPTTGRVFHHLAIPNKIEYMEMTSVKQIAAKEINKYPVKSRQCLFHDELYKTYGGMYSYSTCITRCRIKAMLALCQCMPYYYPAGDNLRGRKCFVDDLKCLQKYKDKFYSVYPRQAETEITGEAEDALHCPECYPDCEQTRYSIDRHRISLGEHFDRSITTASKILLENTTDKCIVVIYYAKSFNVIDRLDIVNTWYQILSNVGGYGSMLIGISLCSIVELIFYFSVRYVQLVFYNLKKYT